MILVCVPAMQQAQDLTAARAEIKCCDLTLVLGVVQMDTRLDRKVELKALSRELNAA